MIERIKKNDIVQVLSGKNRGKQGSVVAVLLKKGKVLVKDIAIAVRHVKPRRPNESGLIINKEQFISISSVMPVCSACKKPVRVNIKALDANKRARACNRCGEIF